MKNSGRVLFLLVAFSLALGGGLFASGKTEAAGAKKQLTIGFNL